LSFSDPAQRSFEQVLGHRVPSDWKWFRS
jgi:hypothetical protein